MSRNQFGRQEARRSQEKYEEGVGFDERIQRTNRAVTWPCRPEASPLSFGPPPKRRATRRSCILGSRLGLVNGQVGSRSFHATHLQIVIHSVAGYGGSCYSFRSKSSSHQLPYSTASDHSESSCNSPGWVRHSTASSLSCATRC